MRIKRKKPLKALAILLSTLFVLSCSTLGPMGKPEFFPLVENATGIKTNSILISSRLSWVTYDLNNCWIGLRYMLACTDEQKDNGYPTADDERNIGDGILILDSSYINILDWNEKNKKYTLNKKIDINNINALEMYEFGASKRIRIGVNKRKYYVLVLMGDTAQMMESTKTADLFNRIKNKLSKKGISSRIF